MRELSRYSGLAVVAIGGFGGLSWIGTFRPLASLTPSWSSMRINTAVCLIVCGLSLWRARLRFLLLVPIAIGALTLFEYASYLNLGIDNLFWSHVGAVGRMAPSTALDLLLVGFAVLSLDLEIKKQRVTEWLAVVVAIITLPSFVGYFYGESFGSGAAYLTKMAFPTAMALMLLAAGLLAARPDRGFMATLTSADAGGLQARLLLPGMICIPLIVGWLAVIGRHAGFYDDEYTNTQTITLTMIFLAALIYWNAKLLNEIDRRRKEAEEGLPPQQRGPRSTDRTTHAGSHHRAGGRARGVEGEVRVSRQHEPRDPHAAQRDHRPRGYRGRVPARFGANQASESDPRLGRSAPQYRERRASIFPKSKRENSSWRRRSFRSARRWENTVGLLGPRAREKNIRLASVTSPEIPAALRGDVGRIGQILINLVGNAIKFTEKGGIAIEADLVEQHGGTCVVRLTVRDSGIGIGPEARSRLFQPFSQADGSTARRYGGTGLGLSICGKLVGLMHGKIGVESSEGNGSTFWVELPLRLAQSEASTQRPTLHVAASVSSTKKRNRLLVAEDNPINQQLAQLQLEKLGYSVRTVGNGREAIEALAQENFDLVLMDVQMPEMDGFEATRSIREIEALTGKRIPIVAMTANAIKGDEKRCSRSGHGRLSSEARAAGSPGGNARALARRKTGGGDGRRGAGV